jgi:hypothetical protein
LALQHHRNYCFPRNSTVSIFPMGSIKPPGRARRPFRKISAESYTLYGTTAAGTYGRAFLEVKYLTTPASKRPIWPIQPSCVSREKAINPSAFANLGTLLNTLDCLPGAGLLIIVIDNQESTAHNLPFTSGFISRELRIALLRAMTVGGGCEVRLQLSETKLVLAACLGFGVWRGCTTEQIRSQMELERGDIAVSFPAAGSVERRTSTRDTQG